MCVCGHVLGFVVCVGMCLGTCVCEHVFGYVCVRVHVLDVCVGMCLGVCVCVT
jgi:hypothetical protein